NLKLRLFRRIPRLIAHDCDVRVQPRIELLDAREVCLHHLNRRDLPLAQQRRQFRDVLRSEAHTRGPGTDRKGGSRARSSCRGNCATASASVAYQASSPCTSPSVAAGPTISRTSSRKSTRSIVPLVPSQGGLLLLGEDRGALAPRGTLNAARSRGTL